jgi:hypothetical protein
MGVIYSYYDAKNHIAFEMGKWYGWDGDLFSGYLEPAQIAQASLSAVGKLYLPETELAGLLRVYIDDFDMPRDEKDRHAAQLAAQLIAFQETTDRASVSWVNDADDSDDPIYNCGHCGKFVTVYVQFRRTANHCACDVPRLCRHLTRYRPGDKKTK